MYVLLELEIKLTMDGELEYVESDIEKCDSEVTATERMEEKKKEILDGGYFNKVICETPKQVTLHNGGTVYKKLKIQKL